MSGPGEAEIRPRRRTNLLLRPAAALMNRLKYPQKFLLISLFFAAPLVVAMYFLLSEFGDRIEFTRKETQGTRYLRPVMKLFRHAGEARRLARSFAAGGRDARPELVQKLGEIGEDFKAIDAVDKELGAVLKIGSRLSLLKNNWNFLSSESQKPEPKDNDPLHESLLAEIRRLISYVGDTSNLILDPDLDTYYLMDSILLKLPQGQSLVMESGFRGEKVAAQKSVSPEERAQLISHTGRVRSNLDETREGIEKASQNNPSGTVRPRLHQPFVDFHGVGGSYIDFFNREIVDARTVTITPEAFAGTTGRLLEASFELWDHTVAVLDELMKARIDLYDGRRTIAWVTTFLLLGLVGYLWVGFYAAVMRTVSALEEASGRMLGDDPGHDVALETKDELGRVTESFNAIAQRLRREWKQAHEDNARARAAEAGLQESEERTRLILQSALDAVITIDSVGTVTEWNPQAVAIFGRTREEAVGHRLSDLIIPDRFRKAHEDGLRRFAATGEGPVLNKRIEISALRRDGTEFPVELSIIPVRSSKGTAFSAFLQDITDRKRGEEELRHAKEGAEKASLAKSEFLASMSHELRTPLNSIIGFSTVVLKGKGKHLPEQDATYVERILDNGKHLLGLINTILDLSKIEARKTELRVVPVALDSLIRETLAQLEGRLVDKSIRLVAELPPRVAPLSTDPDKLKQILINLVGNALKFTERGSVTVRVIIDPQTDVARRIEVIDTGVGIPQEALERIFEAFQQVDTGMARKYEGTGLGLTISRSLSNLLGYRIEVQSEVGKGSTFCIHLGATRSAGSPDPAPPAAPADGMDADLKDKLVLVIDDEEDSRVLLRQYVTDCGCRVVEAASGPEAIRKARELIPDLITLDLMMPGMNGWDVLRTLKADVHLREVPVVVVSIAGRENRGTIFGAADLLNKPVAREELCAVLRRNVQPGPSKVLVVDDDPDARTVMSEYLSQENAQVVTAENGHEALKKLEKFTPDLVILDLMMPVMDGMAFLGTLRRDSRFASLQVVVVTAKELTVQEIRQLEVGVAAVLKKGDELKADLARVFRSVLRRKVSFRTSDTRIRIRPRPVVADMVPAFLDARRQDVGSIRAALERGDLEAIRTLGHNMKGVGSAYGFEPITQIGSRLEEAARTGAREEIRRQVDELASYLSRVELIAE